MKLCHHRWSNKGRHWCLRGYKSPKPECRLWDLFCCKVRVMKFARQVGLINIGTLLPTFFALIVVKMPPRQVFVFMVARLAFRAS